MDTPPARWNGMAVVATGAHRICVRDPADPRCVLKFERPPHERPAAGLRARLRYAIAHRLPQRGDNAAEWRAWRLLHARFGDAIDRRFARCHGLVDTPFGRALRQDCVHDATGEPAPSLFRLLGTRAPYPPDVLCRAVEEFEQWLLGGAVPLFDLNAGNFVVVSGQAGVRLVCIDAKSVVAGRELVPVSRWLPALMRRKIARRAARLRARIREAAPTA